MAREKKERVAKVRGYTVRIDPRGLMVSWRVDDEGRWVGSGGTSTVADSRRAAERAIERDEAKRQRAVQLTEGVATKA